MQNSAEFEKFYRKKARLAFPIMAIIAACFLALSLVSLHAGLLWGTLIDLPLLFLSLFLLGFTYSHHAGIAWWRQRIKRRATAIDEYTFNVEADARLIGLEPVNRIEFQRKGAGNSVSYFNEPDPIIVVELRPKD